MVSTRGPSCRGTIQSKPSPPRTNGRLSSFVTTLRFLTDTPNLIPSLVLVEGAPALRRLLPRHHPGLVPIPLPLPLPPELQLHLRSLQLFSRRGRCRPSSKHSRPSHILSRSPACFIACTLSQSSSKHSTEASLWLHLCIKHHPLLWGRTLRQTQAWGGCRPLWHLATDQCQNVHYFRITRIWIWSCSKAPAARWQETLI
mmetsp:Transcript_58926/g.129350  ORF Transcript_58926/g.129350 Transcript_58926/m.129350 type:complete len:200 (-) Transcript_58926:1327-1926(-)